MKFHLYRRPYNIGMGWRKYAAVDAINSVGALKTTEFKDEKMEVDGRDPRIGILGGISEFVALTDQEIEGWNEHSEIPKRTKE